MNKPEEQDKAADDVIDSIKGKAASTEISFLSKFMILLGVAVAITALSLGFRQPNQGSLLGIQYIADSTSSSTLSTTAVGFSFRAFGHRFLLPEYAPGYLTIYSQSGTLVVPYYLACHCYTFRCHVSLK